MSTSQKRSFVDEPSDSVLLLLPEALPADLVLSTRTRPPLWPRQRLARLTAADASWPTR